MAGATRSRTRKDVKRQVLLVTDETGLAGTQAALAALPLCTRGSVFVEVPDASVEVALAHPPRMVVTVIARDARGADGVPAEPMTAVARAVGAWASEMMVFAAPISDEHPVTEVSVLLGGHVGGHDDLLHLLATR
ncbi:SIP domain-containing protein [Clavibacter michiganensis subsp. phaseoli]|uniref:SIP domain-containing protein n=1 Tax=Clavibacter phaseoli TaxID=1734031 RepID=A0A8I0SBF1_9MICO|nr:SIP domain-containing protein [Clavibacter phaseoli]MBF4630205.1 SIP domain-containing protein [Clavibacter phaseoli]